MESGDIIQNLIKELRSLIAKLREEDSEQWEEVHLNLSEILIIYRRDESNEKVDLWLARVLISLPRYLSELEVGFSDKKINNHISKIVDASFKYLKTSSSKNSNLGRKYQVCGKHEDGACLTGPYIIPYAFQKWSKINKKFPSLDKKFDGCFLRKPLPISLPPGTKLIRVIEKNASLHRWWILSNLPQSKKEWRDEYAVLKVFNENGYYLNWEIENEPIYAWIGIAANQEVWWGPEDAKTYSNETCLLRGGKIQVLVDPSIVPKNIQKKPTKWK